MTTSNLTKYPDVNEIIDFFIKGVFSALGENVLGIYLTGSLSHGAFNYHSSDIDITVIMHRPVSRCELDSIGRLHREMEGRFEKWAQRLECSYTPVDMPPMCYASNGALDRGIGVVIVPFMRRHLMGMNG